MQFNLYYEKPQQKVGIGLRQHKRAGFQRTFFDIETFRAMVRA